MEAKYFGKITDLDPYASSPKNVKPLSKSHKLPLLKIDEPLALRFNCKMRNEDFGAIIYTPESGAVLLNQDSRSLLKELQERELFTIQYLDKEFSNHSIQNLQYFFTSLVDRKLVRQMPPA